MYCAIAQYTLSSSAASYRDFRYAVKKAVLSLKVTPHITRNHQVKLLLQVNKDAISKNVTTARNIPIIDTREIKTKVLVNDGQTIVLGGIYETTRQHLIKRVPFFGKLPLIGWLFRRTIDATERKEMLIFITTKIVYK
ncbi:MAG: hypothetical protein COC15_05040 [Legionellales bacterium]|nr:MAG: hypothetical protein COC15_05040 [Legionellales bacterium]